MRERKRANRRRKIKRWLLWGLREGLMILFALVLYAVILYLIFSRTSMVENEIFGNTKFGPSPLSDLEPKVGFDGGEELEMDLPEINEFGADKMDDMVDKMGLPEIDGSAISEEAIYISNFHREIEYADVTGALNDPILTTQEENLIAIEDKMHDFDMKPNDGDLVNELEIVARDSFNVDQQEDKGEDRMLDFQSNPKDEVLANEADIVSEDLIQQKPSICNCICRCELSKFSHVKDEGHAKDEGSNYDEGIHPLLKSIFIWGTAVYVTFCVGGLVYLGIQQWRTTGKVEPST